MKKMLGIGTLALILIIILVLMLLGGLPLWPHGGFGYGWYPSFGLIVIILLILLLAGRL